MSEVETNNPNEGLGDLNKWFADRLSGEATPPASEPKAKIEATEQPEDDVPDALEVEDDESAQHEQAAPEAEDEGEPEQDPETDNLTEYEVEPGKKVKLPDDLYEQIKPALLRHADYTRKTQEVAELRKTAEAERAAAQSNRGEYLQGLQVVQHVLGAMVPPMPAPELRDHDYIEYMRQKDAHIEAVTRMQATFGEIQRVQAHNAAEEEANFKRNVQEGIKRIPDLIPEWRDPARAEREQREVAGFLLGNGYTNEELHFATDPRAIAISLKAMKYDRIMAKKQAAKPVAPKVEKPGPARNPSVDSAALRSKRALEKSGKADDGIAYFASLLNPKRK